MKKKKISNLPISRLAFPSAYLAVLVFNLLTIALIFLLKSQLPPEIPLFYGRPFGQEQLAQSIKLIILPITAFVIALFNAILSVVISSRFLTQILLGVAIITTTLAFIAVLQIIFLVGSFWP